MEKLEAKEKINTVSRAFAVSEPRKENPRTAYGIGITELPLLDRGSSAMKTGLAVSNPRISE